MDRLDKFSVVAKLTTTDGKAYETYLYTEKGEKEKRRMRVIDIICELVCIQAILYSPGHTTLKLATTINRINGLIRKLLDSNCIYGSVEELVVGKQKESEVEEG